MNNIRRSTRSVGRTAALLAALWASLLPWTAVGQVPGENRAAVNDQPPSPSAAPDSPIHVARLRPIQGGQMIAQVGTQVILASELMWPISQRLASEYHGQLTPEMIEQVYAQAAQTMKNQLPGLLDFKLIVNDVHEKIPPEAIENVEKELAKSFEDDQLANLLEQFSVGSRAELDARLRQYGSTVAQLRENYIEAQLVQSWLREQVTGVEPITRDDLYREYEAHLDEYAYPATAKWQELMVRFDRFGGDRRAAHLALAEMGNAVRNGAPFEEVARTRSQGFTAAEGGAHDWTAQGSLVAERIDAALFHLPVGSLSEIIETAEGLHIVRVLERRPAGRTPFEEAQAEIRETLLARRRTQKQREYLDRLRKEVRIWTIYTGPTTAEEYANLAASASRPE